MTDAAPAIDPFEQLLEYEQALHDAGITFPDRDDSPDRWSGIAFRVGDARYVAAMNNIHEIVDPPECTRVPGTVPWFPGVANVRGSLIPVIDLHGFVTGGRALQARNARLLIHAGAAGMAGFRVDDVFGMKRFHSSMEQKVKVSEVERIAAAAGPLAAWVDSVFHDGGEIWPVLDLGRFALSEAFMNVSRRADQGGERSAES